jgi:hypothetical protein
MVMGMLRYRTGEVEAAIEPLSKMVHASDYQRGLAGLALSAKIFLAMAHQRLGHVEEARRELEEARTARGIPPRHPITWRDHAIADVLLGEAEDLIPMSN